VKRFAIICAALCACQPRPLNVAQERSEFPRAELISGGFILQELPADAKPVGVTFEDTIELLGSKVEPAEPSPGQSITITTWFRLKKQIPESWKIFLHVDGIGRSHRIHGDHCPCDGDYPTSYWKVGEVIADRHVLTTHGQPRSDYNVWVGFYIDSRRMKISQGESGKRDKDNRALVARLPLGQ
jgi:hypothetical protein